MSHDHAHGPETQRGSENRRRLAIVLGLSLAFVGVEVVGAWVSGSLALLAEAGHMLTDAAGLALALVAMWFATRAPSTRRSYGYHRVEILAAAVNAMALLGLSFFVLYEAVRRLHAPRAVASRSIMAIAAIGLVINLIGVMLLRRGSQDSLNVKGAYLEVLSDAATAVGVILAGAIMWATGWYYADPLVSAIIGVLMIPRTWKILGEAVGILLEGTPADVDTAALREAIATVPGVAGVHDLHVWSLTSGVNALSVHAVLADGARHGDVLGAVQRCLRERFKIAHATVQVESPEHGHCESHL